MCSVPSLVQGPGPVCAGSALVDSAPGWRGAESAFPVLFLYSHEAKRIRFHLPGKILPVSVGGWRPCPVALLCLLGAASLSASGLHCQGGPLDLPFLEPFPAFHCVCFVCFRPWSLGRHLPRAPTPTWWSPKSPSLNRNGVYCCQVVGLPKTLESHDAQLECWNPALPHLLTVCDSEHFLIVCRRPAHRHFMMSLLVLSQAYEEGFVLYSILFDLTRPRFTRPEGGRLSPFMDCTSRSHTLTTTAP